MFLKEDTTYNDMRYASMMQWLNQLKDGDDKVNQYGAKLTVEYIDHLNQEIEKLKKNNALKDEFLRRMKENKK